jgi:acetolactate synthase I/II/III large subunit
MTTGGYTLLQAPRPAQKLVHIHAGAEELGRVYAADLLLQASMACAAKALETLAAPPSRALGRQAAAAHADYLANLERHAGGAAGHGGGGEDAAAAGPETPSTPTAPATSAAGCTATCVPGLQHHGRTQLAPTSGAMGYGLPAAVAAALLQPDRTRGQPGRRRRLPDDRPGAGHRHRLRRRAGGRLLVSIVVDNGTYGTIRMHQEREYPGRVSGSDLFNPDFAALARAYGWHAERWSARPTSSRRCRAPCMAAGRPTAAPEAGRRRQHQPQHADGDPRRQALADGGAMPCLRSFVDSLAGRGRPRAAAQHAPAP